MIAVGSAVLFVSVVSTAVRIASTRHGLHPSVLFPVVVIAAAVLCVPVGLEMGGAWATAARWALMFAALSAIPAGNLLGSAVVAHRRLRTRDAALYDEGECPSLSEISEAERSLEDEYSTLVYSRTPLPRAAEYR